MNSDLAEIQSAALAAIESASDAQSLDQAKIDFLGKKGRLTAASALMKSLPNEEKPAFGAALNTVRGAITSALEEKQTALQHLADLKAIEGIDPTLPGRSIHTGGLHPLTRIKDDAIQILRRMGFALAAGPEIEDEFHCFDALNTPADHPARNEKDTFYFDSGKLLRTHTSSVQVRTMENETPPVRIIAPGSAYRRDEIDATHLSVCGRKRFSR